MAARQSPKSNRNNDDLRVANLAPLLYNGKAKAIGGRLAQRLERLVHTEEAGGSNPPSPTIEGNLMLPLPPSLGADHRAEVAKRQTRCVQGAVSFMDVWVQIPPSAPALSERKPAAAPSGPGRPISGQGKIPRIPCACSSVERALPCGGRGRGFESRQARHFFANG